jgi:hypothetical protein
MVASNKTIEAIHEAIRRHVSPDIELAIFTDLCEVPGNQSFRDTIQLLLQKAQQRYREANPK